jgi:hypothetical protein
MMKRLLSLTAALALSATGLLAQNNLTITVNDNNSNPLDGVAVFFYDSPAKFGSSFNPSSIPPNFSGMSYTNNQGQANSFFLGTISPNDTVFWAAADCQGLVVWGAGTPASLATVNFSVSLSLACAPLVCDALVRTDTIMGFLLVEAYSLRDSASGPGGSLFPRVSHNYLIDGQYTTSSLSSGANYDSIMTPLSTFNSNAISVCYSRLDSVCPYSCDSVVVGQSGGGNPNPVNCNASYFADSVNSGLFQGQIILGENSTTSRGSIVSYDWDFGDGTTISAQYPSHTYANATGVYNVCLTITAVDGQDTCVSTYCDSIGFDANGNPVFKGGAGFTINVVNPATFSVAEDLLGQLSLYPNPAQGPATLTWSSGVDLEAIEVLNLNGQLVQRLQPEGAQVEISNLPAGAYLVKVNTAKTSAALRLIVQ